VNYGALNVQVWPPYIGLSTAEGEPFDDMNYCRGFIQWRTLADKQIVGSAKILAPKGVYTSLVFYWGPDKVHPAADNPHVLEHPVVFDRPGTIEIDPITNNDYLPRL
jgi:hypothetical protein